MEAAIRKKQFGQFFTSNCDSILRGFEERVFGKNVIDPFAGNGDLLRWAEKNGARSTKGHEIDPSYVDDKKVFFRDSILDPGEYEFVLTNPPYLNINKADLDTKKRYLAGSGFEDLYHVALKSIMNSQEGIVIVPINFLSSPHARKIREVFFIDFYIPEMNYFQQQVFQDTTYNVIAFHYRRKSNSNFYQKVFKINTHIYPEGGNYQIELSKDHGWIIGGAQLEGINSQPNSLRIKRLTEEDIEEERGAVPVTAAYNHVKERRTFNISEQLKKRLNSNIILLKAIDSGSESGKISLEDIRTYGISCLVSKPSSRHMIYLLFPKEVTLQDQEKLIDLFNREFNELRKKHLSLFLTNYRDKNRKRVSFDFVYRFLNHLYIQRIK